ncbi:hypothetical protein VTO42DRAFT_8449 [Malbranchea cinnamomea]
MGSNNQMHNFTTLIKRLEAATSRLEDMAATLDTSASSSAIAPPSQADAPQSQAKAVSSTSIPAPEPLPRSIEAWDKIVNGEVNTFVEISQQIGGPVATQAKAVRHAFEAERTYLLVATKARKPDPQPAELLTELHMASDEINSVRESNRASPMFTQLSAVAEGTIAMGWFFEPRPAEFLTDTLGGVQFYGNRVLKEYKDKDNTQVEFMQAYYRIFKAMISYVKEYYPRGFTWNPDGIDALEALKQIKGQSEEDAKTISPPSVPNTSGGAPPPPPPPPPAPAPAAKSSAPDMSAVFEQLNQGSAITSNLRKVDQSQMTHKNPNLRASSLVPEHAGSQSSGRGKSPAPSRKPKPENLRAKKLPRKRLDGNKWFVEHFDNSKEIIEIPAEITHSILISRCNKIIVKIHNKANAIQVDNCSELSIIVDSLVSSLEVIKTSKFQLQIDGTVPTVVMDQVDGATVYLNEGSLETEFFTSKCTAVNVVLPPKEGTDEDAKECPIPEQIRSYIKDGALVSEIVEHAG